LELKINFKRIKYRDILLIINYFVFTLNDPLSRFPQGGKALLSALLPPWGKVGMGVLIIKIANCNSYVILKNNLIKSLRNL